MTAGSGAATANQKYFNPTQAIELGGIALTSDQMSKLISYEVETVAGRPDSIELRFHIPMDAQGTPKDLPSAWAPGAAMAVKVADVELFEGEVTSVDFVGGVDGLSEIVLHGYDKRHRLYRNDTVEVMKDVSISDIVGKLVRANGLSTGALHGLPTTVFKYHLHQGTAGDYLDRLCDEFGLWCVAEPGGKVALKDGPSMSTEAAVLTFGLEVFDFHFRQTTSGDRTKATVRGWDPKKKEAIVGSADRGQALPGTDPVLKSTQTTFASAAAVLHEAWVPAQKDAENLAKGALAQAVDAGMQLDATCTLLPKIKAGTIVEAKGFGARFSGKYRVTAARHTYDMTDGGRTTITCRGSDDVTVTGLIESAVAHSPVGNGRNDHRIDGVHIGLVAAVKSKSAEGAVGDAGAAGEVKVKLPWLADNLESSWMRVVTVGGGKDRGFYVMPEVNDEVLVAFEGGDPRRGYVLGGLYNGQDTAPRSDAQLTDGTVIQERVWKSRAGHEIVLGDKKGEEFILIKSSDEKYQLVFDVKEEAIRIQSQGDVTITAEKELWLESKDAMHIKAGKDLTIEGQNVKMEGKQNVDIKATSNATVEGTGGAAVKGAKVDITSQGPATVKGNPIMLN
jgi:phage baseplate assembly protein gpV